MQHSEAEWSASALAEADDGLVAARAADGDTAAFAVLVRRYTPLMRAYARRMLGSSADVDDVVQESFVTAWSRLGELADPSKVKSWLMRITSHRAIDTIRSRKQHGDVDDFDAPASEDVVPSNAAEVSASVTALRGALAELPEDQRECWVLREIGGQSYDEIAEQLHLPASTVRGLLARARKHIIVRMEEWR